MISAPSIVETRASRGLARAIKFGWHSAVFGAALTVGAAVSAQPCRLPACAVQIPADAGAVNVREFGAKGDGVTDDTAALLAAIAASGVDTGDRWWNDRIVYLPAGTYLVSDSLLKRYRNGRFASGLSLQGDGPDRTTIRLADHGPRFQDRATPRAVVMTSSKLIDTSGNRDYIGKGEGNDAYGNFVEALTIDVGAGNPGAIGIDYLASNFGAIRNVVIQAPPGSGETGISMLRLVPGPAIIQSTQVKGFRTGISIAHSQYGMTLSNVELVHQLETGLRNDGNAVSAERLSIVRAGQASVVNAGPGGLITLVDSAVGRLGENRGTIVLRATHAILPGSPLAETVLDGTLQSDVRFKPLTRSWTVPRVTLAAVDPGPSEQWVGVDGSTDQRPMDATGALQRAMDSGARTIYLRKGTFWLSAPVVVPASVHRILGMGSTLQLLPQRRPGLTPEDPLLLVREPGEPLEIDRLTMFDGGPGVQIGVRHDSPRTLLLRDLVSAGVTVLDRTARGGTAALENSCCGSLRVAGPAPVTARQFDTEGGGIRIQNAGTPLSVIGLKTEQQNTVVQTTAGGRTEMLGGLVYLVTAPEPPMPPMFITREARFAASLVEEVLVSGRSYPVYLRDDTPGHASEIKADSMPVRGLGRILDNLSTGPQ